MKIILLNFSNKVVVKRITEILLVTVLLIAMSISIVLKVYQKELYINTSNNVFDKGIVILDAGHGGEDSGAVGVNGALEKELNLDIVLHIGEMLGERGYTVVYTRTDDALLYKPSENIKGIRKISDLRNRCKIADEYPEAVFVSIHMNSFGSSKYSGLQVYYSEQDNGSKELASFVQNEVKDRLQKGNNRKIKEGKNIYVLENIDNTAILVECGFLTNAEECNKLCEKEYQKQLSFSIVCGIIKYMENLNLKGIENERS